MKTNRHLFCRIAGGLTALATALVMLPASAMAAPGNIPAETCTVDYNTQDGEYIVLNYTIEESAPENLVIDLAEKAIQIGSDIQGLVPGDTLKFRVNITNESGHTYKYKDNSFVIATNDSDQYGSLEEGSLIPVLTYDGQYLYYL